jgi:hypothetical protein|tara:strand:- start:1098 stop:1292 length:195 start_codon:yes stop_codon:yes gene_type:complete
MIMNVSIKENNGVSTLTIEVPVSLRPSNSGKTMLVASSGGNQTTTAQVDGKNVIVGLNAYIPKG